MTVERIVYSACDYEDVSVLRSASPEFVAELIDRLQQDVLMSAAHRQRTLYILGRLGDPSAVEPVQRLLPRLDERERLTAIEALGRIGTQEAIDLVIQYADDPSADVRRFVVTALRRTNAPAAAEQLRRMADEDAAEFVRDKARRAYREVEQSHSHDLGAT